MSTAGSQTQESALLNQQVEILARDSAALAAAVNRGRVVRAILLLALVALLAWIITSFYKMGHMVMYGDNEYHAQLKDAAQKYLDEHSGIYMDQLKGIYDNTSPAVTKAFYAQSKKDMPLFLAAVEKQRDQLRTDLETQLRDRLTKRYEKLLADRQGMIKKEMPEVTDQQQQDRIEKNMQTALNHLIKRMYLDKMDEQLQLAFADWDNFPTAPPRQTGSDSLEDELQGSLLDLLSYRLAHTSASYNGAP